MKRLIVATVFSAALVGGVSLYPTGVSGASGGLTLHPSGFGAHSYSAWKAQQGLQDDNGASFQALYFQKMTATTTNAAGVAVIKGLEGTPAQNLTGLSWTHRTDGHCGAGAPRWDVFVHNTSTNTNRTVFLGCNAAQHTPVAASGPTTHTWCQDSYSGPALSSQFMSGDVITGLAIVFDEGNDTPNPPPAGCDQENLTPGGYVYLDNITVTDNGVTHVWTDASDNGNGQTIARDPANRWYLQHLLGHPVSKL